MSAPNMTMARLGSQSPAISRKPRTLAGSIMCETGSPRPKRTPATSALMRRGMPSASDDVPHDEHRDESGSHEQAGGNDRTRREARHAADAMTAGAATAESGAEAD